MGWKCNLNIFLNLLLIRKSSIKKFFFKLQTIIQKNNSESSSAYNNKIIWHNSNNTNNSWVMLRKQHLEFIVNNSNPMYKHSESVSSPFCTLQSFCVNFINTQCATNVFVATKFESLIGATKLTRSTNKKKLKILLCSTRR